MRLDGWSAALGAVAFAITLGAVSASAQDRAGDFDFYVLSLSWSPSYCEAEGGDRDTLQCGGGQPFSFVVHGLWPQYERGYPEFCRPAYDDQPRRDDVDAILDVMPAPGLVRYQWRKHGSCSGLPAEDYLDLVRAAYARIVIPPALKSLEHHVTVNPDAVESAFRAANPGLDAGEVAVICDDRRLREVRICLTKDLEFTDCPEVDRRDCSRSQVVMPPVR